jgi:O-antigen/teichoic acid export membrane protein
MRRERSIKNLVFGLLSFVITTIIGVIIPRLFIVSYGSEVNGLVSSVKQIFAYFTLLEAGVGTATQQALYGALAVKDRNGVSGILSATNHFYKKTGIIYAIAVFLLAIFYPITVQSDIPVYVIVAIILFQGEAGVVRYLVTAKLQLLLNADGKSYITTNISTIFSVLSNLARVVLLYAGCSVLWVQAIFCIVDICQVIIIVLYTRKHYAWLDLNAKPNYSALDQRHSVLFHQISGLVFNNTDTIILTYFCGLQIVSVYSMYAMLYAMIANVVGYFASSVTFALGQIFNEDRKRFHIIQSSYETYFLALSFSLFTVAYIFILPFLRLYTSGITDINYIDKWLPILFLVFQVLDYGRKTSSNIINFACHFKQTQWRSFLETSINLLVSILSVTKFGIYGVLLGTVAALTYRTNDMILYANHKILGRSAFPTYRRWGRDILLMIICIACSAYLPNEYGGYLQLFVYAVPVAIGTVVLFIGVNTAVEKEVRRVAIEFARPLINKIKGRL